MIKQRHQTPYRCAVYFAPPPDSPWGQAGSHWLGRCAATGPVAERLHVPGVSQEIFEACTAEPRRYGWHATLKAPFALVPGQDLGSVLSWLQLLARELKAFTLPALQVAMLGNFLALRPQQACLPLQDAANACVMRLQHLALPLGDAELARRRRAPLTTEQDELLLQWGYPWVLNHFRFHFSLTGPLDKVDPGVREALLAAAVAHFGSLPACRFDRLSLFVEPEKGVDFQLVEQVELRT